MAYNNTEYQSWLDMGRQNQPTYNAGGTRTLGSNASPTGGYQYNPNWGTQDFLKANVKQDLWSGKGKAGIIGSPSGQFAQMARAYQGRKKFKDERANEERIRQSYAQAQESAQQRAAGEFINAYDPTSRAAQYARERSGAGNYANMDEIQAVSRQEQVDRLRDLARGTVDSYFDDPRRQGEYEKLINDQLNADKSQIGQQFDRAGLQAQFAAARTGQRGGSMDQERQAEVQGGRQAALVGAAQTANRTASNLTARDQANRQQLLALINSDDPYARQAAAAQLQGLAQQSTNDAYANVAAQTRQQANQFFNDQTSQTLGQGFQGWANILRQDPSLSQYYTPARN